MKKSLFASSIFFIVCWLVAMGMPANAADVIKIGVIGPMNFMQGKGPLEWGHSGR